MTKRMGANERQEQILALWRQAGPQGLTYRELAAAANAHAENMRSVCNRLRNEGLLARVGGRFMLREFLPEGVAQDGPRVRSPDAKPRQVPGAPRGFDPRMLERASFIQTKCQTTFGDVVVPAGVRITVVAAPRGRYEPDPGHRGEFMRDWRRARRPAVLQPQPEPACGQ